MSTSSESGRATAPGRPAVDRPLARDTLVVIVHFGDTEPSVGLANDVAVFAPHVVVVANDRTSRPEGLSHHVEWMLPPSNLGYAGALKYAVAHATPRAFVALLNSDIHLPPATFEHCLQQLDDDSRLGVVAPVLRYPDGSLQSGAGLLVGPLRREQVVNDPGCRLAECTWVTGAVMFLRYDALLEAGCDASYFLGFEDIDLCLRLARHGYRVACDGRVAAVHEHAQEIGSLWHYYYFRNRLWFARKNYAVLRVALIAGASWVNAGKVCIGDLVRRKGFARAALVVAGVRDGVKPELARRREPLPDEPRPLTLGLDRSRVA